MDKFWRWVTNEAEGNAIRTLYLEGYIAEQSWFDDEISPKQFKTELYGDGSMVNEVVVKIHSPGGDCFAAAQIYNMLKEYPGKVSIHIDGLAASAASVIAMAGDVVCVSPLSVIMIHNPAMFVGGEISDLEAGINLLSEVKESIINAYQKKSGLSRAKISHMMDAETWMSANKAIDLKFADSILYEYKSSEDNSDGFIFDKLTVTNALINKLPKRKKVDVDKKAEIDKTERQEEHKENKPVEAEEINKQIPVNQLQKRLELIKNWR